MKMASRHQGIKASRARGFTLVELMIAVGVLVVIIVATSKIFSTAGKVTSLGQATADVLQETTAIERQIRSDFERLAPNGVFAIRCVSIRNDINVPLGPLLNPALPEDAMIRADQLLFFTNGVQSIQTYRQGPWGSNHRGQGTAGRIYYGHAFQLPEGEDIDVIDSQQVRAQDPVVDFTNPLVPWYRGPYPMVRTVFRSNFGGSPPDYFTFDVGEIDATQPVAPQWLLARQAVLLADDGGSQVVFLNENRSAFTIADAVVRNGRVDAAAGQLNDIRSFVTIALVGGMPQPRPWWDTLFADDNGVGDQRSVISSAVFYPRAERVAPGMHRVDQALTNNVLAGACSSFIVDWTYSNGVGEVLDGLGNTLWNGVQIAAGREQPWFGLDADLDGDGILERGVHFYNGTDFADPNDMWWTGAQTIFFDNIEPPTTYTQAGQALEAAGAVVYEAFFGYNRDQSLDFNLDPPAPNIDLGYTPWPSSIRITMVLHDPATKLEVGREVQFVINLPNRVR